jgi:hypothetical protein
VPGRKPASGELSVNGNALGHAQLGTTKHRVKLDADEIDFLVIRATPDAVQQRLAFA